MSSSGINFLLLLTPLLFRCVSVQPKHTIEIHLMIFSSFKMFTFIQFVSFIVRHISLLCSDKYLHLMHLSLFNDAKSRYPALANLPQASTLYLPKFLTSILCLPLSQFFFQALLSSLHPKHVSGHQYMINVTSVKFPEYARRQPIAQSLALFRESSHL